MMRLVSKLIFQMLGWSVIGHTKYPRKSLVIAAPHTSNWDFFFGRCYAYIVGFSPKYLIKSELFLPILGKLIKINGGIPVYRDSNNNVVEQISNKLTYNFDFPIMDICPVVILCIHVLSEIPTVTFVLS